MTRDEVMALTDDELRIEAAELVGWRHSVFGNWPHQMNPPDSDGATVRNCPDYPNDITPAFELTQGHDEWWIDTKSHGNEHQCNILRHQGEVYPCWSGIDSSLARAITRAFVMAMDSE